MEKLKNNKAFDALFRIFIVIFANCLLQLSTMWFLEPANLYAGGATGIAQLIRRVILLLSYGNINASVNGAAAFFTNLGFLVFVVNIPILLCGVKFVSKRFALYSLIAVVSQTIISSTVKSYTSPFTEAGPLALCLMGGLVSGLASGIALKYGTSTGGIDVVGQAFALHKGVSIGVFTLAINILIAIIGGGVLQGDFVITLYTCLRMVLNSVVMDKVHTAYTYTAINIFTEHDKEITGRIMNDLKRGCSVFDAKGAYTNTVHKEIYCIVSTYEIHTVTEIINTYDPKAFVVMSPVKSIKGNFIKKTIV